MTANLFDPLAITFFFVFVVISYGIVTLAAANTRDAAQFYAAGANFSSLQNGLALVGEFLSGASFLGIAGLVALNGFDGLIYSIGYLVGWPIMTFLIAEPLRSLGKYTWSDVVAYRLYQKPTRIAAAISTLAIVSVYMIALMASAGTLLKFLFLFDYELAILLTGGVLLGVLVIGGMIATTWLQIVKAILLLSGAVLLSVLVLANYKFNPLVLFDTAAAKYQVSVLAPGRLISDPWNAISLGMSLIFGIPTLPHILMRLYTVPDTRAVRTSISYATAFLGFFYLLTFILGFGAMALVGQAEIKETDASGNMAVPMLAHILGGGAFLGFIAAVSFLTILTVLAGVTLSGAATLSHDLWVHVMHNGQSNESEQLKVARGATALMCILAIALGLVFRGQNVAYMIGLGIAISASTNFPALLLSLFWQRFTTNGAVASMLVGTIMSLVLIYLSPVIQVDILKHSSAIFPLQNPGLVTIPLSFITGIVVSLVAPERLAQQKFNELEQRVQLGSESSTIDTSTL